MNHPLELQGKQYRLTPFDRQLARVIGNAQDQASRARGTRNAGANTAYRIRGALGEIVVARILGIAPQVRALNGPDPAADIQWQGFQIEVKTGLPLEAKSKLNTTRWYVVVQPISDTTFTVITVKHGADILQAAQEPPAQWCPRPGTQQLNWRIDV